MEEVRLQEDQLWGEEDLADSISSVGKRNGVY